MLWRVTPRAPLAIFAAAVAIGVGCSSDDGSAAPADTASTPPTRTAASAGPEASGSRGVRLRRIGNFSQPVFVTAPRGDRRRVFVVEQGGRIRVQVNGNTRSRPFLDISSIVQSGGERGLLSMAFAPDYRSSGRFYVYFTDSTGDIRIQEYRRSSANVANPGSARDVMRIRHRRYGNHNGGQLQFGPDGMLYIGTGDGGGGGDPFRSGQNLGSRLGKILRINPRAGKRYRVPRSNPFRSRSGARGEIWAYGLRNPWRFSFDRKNGRMAIADVGQNEWEEVNFSRRRGRGANYGWSVFEGRARYNGGSAPRHHRPALVKSHSGGWCSITGGYVVRDRSLGGLYGRYIYGDFCRSQIRSVKMRGSRARGDRATRLSVNGLSSFGEDARGRVYVTSLSGPVYRIVAR
jgi:glucose/arabinose dehydrogenase